MPVGSASSQRFRDGGDLSTQSDTTKKKPIAPVDTVALKKQIAKDSTELAYRDRRLGSPDIGPQEEKYQRDQADRNYTRADEGSQVLAAARKGKIPVKKP